MQVVEVTVRTTAPADTRAVGAAAAALLEPGDVVALSGELGAGKTCFVQGVARGLGVLERVTSPTFTLVKSYPRARLPIVHCDIYRLDTLQEVLDLGDEVMAPDVVTCIEWGDAVAALLPSDRLDVELFVAEADGAHGTTPGSATNGLAGPVGDEVTNGARRIRLYGRGRWIARMPELAETCAPWLEAQR